MITLNELGVILADAFGTSTDVVGLMMFAAVMAFIAVFVARKNVFVTMIMMLPLTLAFAAMGLLSTDMTVLMVIVAAVGLALTAREAMQ